MGTGQFDGGWDEDFIGIADFFAAVFTRGGGCYSEGSGGIFYIGSSYGNNDYTSRVVLIPSL